ncbi:MAG: hypothetical protein ACOCYE_10285, partial [Pseudomonadota bacterium]
FQHGVGRYVSWEFKAEESSVKGTIHGSDKLQGHSLMELEGFDFTAQVTYRLLPESLEIIFDVSGDQPVETGIHYYYDIKNQETAKVFLPIEGKPDDFSMPVKGNLTGRFIPRKDLGDELTYTLDTDTYRLGTTVKVIGDPEETFDTITVFSPENETFVCVEPISSLSRQSNVKTVNTGSILLTPTLK